ncbi:uncharacterized protein LOC118745559 [Rhagoletis pomonella]|uniref:uncharacterized protein LOC118745559 n=1 Tax=Rhagoletis pomonella TaxID=28610 RepID=UPI0017872779|nr:uncharacterized protein LOC118745559 [Rhagoletis pomonella]
MNCNCIVCKREVKAGNKPVHDKQVHWTPGDTSHDTLRQRDELRRSGVEAEIAAGGLSESEAGDSPVRRRRRVHVRLHTSEGVPLQRAVGGSGEIGETPTGARRRQRAANRRRSCNPARRNRGSAQFATARTAQQQPQRRRSANDGALTYRMPPASLASGESARQPQPLLREMAACLLSQATILARVVEVLPYGAPAAQQVGETAAQRRARPTRRRPRGQPATAAVGVGPNHGNNTRRRRQGARRRHRN